FFRWLDNFAADGPLPIDSTYDRGFELSVSEFVLPGKLSLYGRGSKVYGEFNDSWEYAVGAKWHPVNTERFWLTTEVMNVHRVPYSGSLHAVYRRAGRLGADGPGGHRILTQTMHE